jgi:hypothetical protein
MHSPHCCRFQARALAKILSIAFAISLPVAAQDASPSVRLTIDYGDGVQKSFVALPWKEKLTVFEALKAAEEHPRGIRVSYTGAGETTFITAIDGQENEGAGERNWRYTVNDLPARYSAGEMELKRGDAVVWRFVK